ncbi:hypothetical protein AAFF_G00361440 [Aldrovandia affinis]|uniref:Solute carrier family 22 member 3 n=1 Tax=Aldrovandia affinis TaxID=143900 RepID=A0AAD7SHQ8_9TELE|nr:hypothetical protein AAFF_G00361440 [Aldrovandia affinis]
MPSFDELLVDVGDFGPYQKMVCFWGCLPGILFAFMFVVVVFLGNAPKHWCMIPTAETVQEQCGWSETELREVSIPQSEHGSFSSCQRFDVDWNRSEISVDWGRSETDMGWNRSEIGCSLSGGWHPSNSTPLVSCDSGWVFEGPHTIISEFELVCEDAWKADLNQAFLNVGLLLGAIVIGYGADRYGRKLCFLISIFGLAVSGVGMIFSPNYAVLLVFRVIQGIFGKGAWMTTYVMVTEIVSSHHRRMVGIMAHIFFSIGIILLPGIAYFIPEWKMLQLTITIPCFLLMGYYWLIPESPRWLFTMKRTKEALEIVTNMAKRNGKTLPPEYNEIELLEPGTEDGSSNHLSPLDAFRKPKMRKYTLILMYAWFTSSVVYQGLIMRLGIVQENLHLEFFISGVVELPSALLFFLTVDRFGRRPPFFLANFIGGLCCLATALIPGDIVWLKSTLAVIGRLAITLGFEIVYLVSTELYPTALRNIGVSMTSSLSDVGGIMAPFFLYRLANVWTELPMVLYGIMSLVYGALVLLLPETKGIDLPETMEDVEALGRNSKDKCDVRSKTDADGVV